MKLLFALMFFCWASISNAQDLSFNLSLTANFGTHIQRAGLQFTTNLEYKDVQLASRLKLHYNLKGLGPIKNSMESILSLGAAYNFGKIDSFNTEFSYLPFTPFKRSEKSYSYGYTFNYFIDRHNTSQGTGDLIYKIKDTYILASNDLLGNLSGSDQYRTGTLALAYAKDHIVLHSKLLMWTGQTRCAEMKRVKTDAQFRSRYGYKDNSSCQHSSLSHGILSIGVSYRIDQYWMPSVGIGRDDERIRNFVQNKLIHDMPFLPRKWNDAQNPHVPMIDKEGKLYLYKEGQEIKSPLWFMQLGLNDGIFY